MNPVDIRSFIREHSVAGFIEGIEHSLNGTGTLPNGQKIRKRRPEEFSLLALYEGMVGPVRDIHRHMQEAGALSATGFPTVTEKLLASIMIPAYDAQMAVANTLVPRIYTPATLTEQIPGFTANEGPRPIPEGDEYPTLGFGDKFATFQAALHNKKEGFEIRITEETIRFDQTGQIMDRARMAAMAMGTERERRTVRAVLGIGSDTGTTQAGVYYPSGVDTALYRAATSNLRTDAAPIYNDINAGTNDSQLKNYTDLAEMMAIHATQIKDDRLVGDARPVAWNPNVLLVPIALAPTAANILQATGIIYTSTPNTSSNPEIRQQSPNPLGVVFGGQLPTPVASTYVDEVSTRKWVLMDNQRSFVRVQIWPIQTFQAPPGYLANRDIVFAIRMREWSRVIALEYRNTMMSGDPS